MNDSSKSPDSAVARFLFAALQVSNALESICGTVDDQVDALSNAGDALGHLEDAFGELDEPDANPASDIVRVLCVRVHRAAADVAFASGVFS